MGKQVKGGMRGCVMVCERVCCDWRVFGSI